MPEHTHDGWEAHVEPDYMRGGIRVLIARRFYDGHVEYLDPEHPGSTVITEPVDPGARPPEPAWLPLPGEQGRALLDALTAFYGQPAAPAADSTLLRELVTQASAHGDLTEATNSRLLDLVERMVDALAAPPTPTVEYLAPAMPAGPYIEPAMDGGLPVQPEAEGAEPPRYVERGHPADPQRGDQP